jgi:uncharacterized protein (TIGR03067 family)
MMTGRVTIDSSARPRKIDLDFGPPNKPLFTEVAKEPNVIFRGIYALDDDVLMMAIAIDQPSIRPKRFATSENDKVSLMILRKDR